MRTSFLPRFLRGSAATSLAAAWLAVPPGAPANDWNTAFGDWANAANWIGGVPNNAGGWAIGNVANGGIAVISTTVPNVSEAWAGNNGIAGTIVVTNGGTLNVDNWLVAGRYGGGGNTPLSTLLVTSGGTLNKTGDGFIIGDDWNCKGQVIVRGTGKILITGGYNQIGLGWNGINEGTVVLQDDALFDTPAFDFNVADWGNAHGHCYIRDYATLNASRFWIGKWDNTVGALWQTGGTINGTGAAANEWTLGGEGSGSPNAFGFYSLAGGLMNNPSFNFQVGRWGKGILYQTGGTNLQGSWTAIGRMAGGLGVTRVSGGRMVHTGGGGTHLIIGEQGRGEFTLSGAGTLDCSTTLVVGHGYNGNNGLGICNLNGGTAVLPGFERWGGGSGYLNLNGATIQPKASSLNFLSGLTEARLHPGHAIFDTAGHDITVNQDLLDAAGTGVTSIPVTAAGAGYMAPPIVQITGDGTGSTAVAEIDPVAGTVTGVVVTSPGLGYTTATASFIGGGATTPAMPGTPTLGAVGSGGVVKNGGGTLTLAGWNSYAGPTTVNQGLLLLTPYSYAPGPVIVGNGAGFGVMLNYPYGQALISSLTLGAGSGATLAFDLGPYGNPFSAVLAVSGTLTLNGTVTVNVADTLPQIGLIPLLQYGSRSGTGNFALGALPPGVQAVLVDDLANKLLYLDITGIGLPRWDGQAGGDWDIGLTQNWIEQSTGLPTFYRDGAPVLFDDQALGVTTVNLVTTVSPASVTVTNEALPYTLVGPGKISGSTRLLKQGPGSLTVANVNDYTGATVIAGGTLAVTNLQNGGVASPIGKSSSAATNLILAGGTLRYSGPATTTDRAYSLQGAGGGIDAQSDLRLTSPVTAQPGGGFVKRGPATLTYANPGLNELAGGAYPGYNVAAGTVLFDSSAGGQVNHNQGELWVGGLPDAGASLVLSNTTLNVDAWFAIGRGNGSVGNVSTVSLYNSALRSARSSSGYHGGLSGNLATQRLTLNGSSTFTNDFEVNWAESSGATSEIFLRDNSTVFSGGRCFVGWNVGATASLTLSQAARMFVNSWLSIGHVGGVGTVTLKDNSYLWVYWDANVTDVDIGEGTFNLQDNAVLDANQVFVGKGTNSVGVFNQTGGAVIARGGGEFHIGANGDGTWNLSAGTVDANTQWTAVGRFPNGIGLLNVSGGAFRHNDPTKLLMIGEQGVGTLTLSGSGAVSSVGDRLSLGHNGGAGTVNLNGGALTVRRVAKGSGSAIFNFNGGTLVAGSGTHLDFMSGLDAAYVLAGGAVIDTAANTVGIVQDLLDGGGGGGLTKLGSGALGLMGVNTYTGLTRVNAGTLGGTGTIAGPVTVASGATLSPGTSIGTLTINHSLSLADGSTTVMEINKSTGASDQVAGTTSVSYGGTLVLKNLAGQLAAGDTFTLFPSGTRTGSFTAVASITPNQTVTWATSQLTVNGTVTVVTATPAPVSLVPVVSGGNVTLSWPINQVGWELQMQASPLTIGITGDWVSVPGSPLTNWVSLPIDPAQGAVFFRLVFP